MGKSKHLVLGSAAVMAASVLGATSALAAACSIAPISTYEASGFSCSVGPVTFSNFTISPTTSGSGTVTLGDLIPQIFTYNGVNEYGLALSYASNTGTIPYSQSDISWIYTVTGPKLSDAYGGFVGAGYNGGTVSLEETFSNGASLALGAQGQTWTTFSPVGQLTAYKDQSDYADVAGRASSSLIVNAFSVSSIPEPSTWAMMVLGFAGLGYAGFRSRKTSISIA